MKGPNIFSGMTKRDILVKQIAEQKKWIADHGGDETGYIIRYGDPSTTETWYGEGGRAIYHADHNALLDLERKLHGYRR